MPTNLQTEQPTLVLFLPVCHCCAELAAEIQTPAWECGTVTGQHRAEQAGELTSHHTPLNVAGCALVQGRTQDFLMTLMHCDIALFQAVHLLVLF